MTAARNQQTAPQGEETTIQTQTNAPLKAPQHGAILLAAPTKFGKTTMVLGSRRYGVVCTEKQGSGWLVDVGCQPYQVHFTRSIRLGSGGHSEAWAVDPLQQVLDQIAVNKKAGLGTYLDGLTALQGQFIEWAAVARFDRRMTVMGHIISESEIRQLANGQAVYGLWAKFARMFLSLIAEEPVLITCLVTSQDRSDKDAVSGEIRKFKAGTLELAPSLSGIGGKNSPIAAHFCSVFVGQIESYRDEKNRVKSRRVWIDPEDDARGEEQRALLPCSDPLGIIQAMRRTARKAGLPEGEGLIIQKSDPVGGVAPFADRIAAFMDAYYNKRSARVAAALNLPQYVIDTDDSPALVRQDPAAT